MRYIVAILMLLLSGSAFAQAPVIVGSYDSADHNLLRGSFQINKDLLLRKLSGTISAGDTFLLFLTNNDTVRVINKNLLGGGGTGTVDSNVYSTVTRLADSVDRLNGYIDSLYGELNSGLSSAVKYSDSVDLWVSFKHLFDSASAIRVDLLTIINAHVTDYNNPHNVTPQQVGVDTLAASVYDSIGMLKLSILGKVSVGDSGIVYMTAYSFDTLALGVYTAIGINTDSLLEHTNRLNQLSLELAGKLNAADTAYMSFSIGLKANQSDFLDTAAFHIALILANAQSIMDAYDALADTSLTLRALIGLSHLQGGNIFGATGVIGTNDAYAFQIKTSGTVRMHFFASGGIGVNTTTNAGFTGMDIFGTTRVYIGSDNYWKFEGTGTSAVYTILTKERTSGRNVVLDTDTRVNGSGGPELSFRQGGEENAYIESRYNPGILAFWVRAQGSGLGVAVNEVFDLNGQTRRGTFKSGNSAQSDYIGLKIQQDGLSVSDKASIQFSIGNYAATARIQHTISSINASQLRIFTASGGIERNVVTFDDGGNMIYNVKNIGIYGGSGSPEGVVTANVGSIYHRTDGGAGTTIYVKESGSGNTGWVAYNRGYYWQGKIAGEADTLTTGVKLTFRMPYAGRIIGVKAAVNTASSSGNVTLDIHDGATTIMNTDKITILAGQTSSLDGGATQPVITDNTIAADAVVTLHVDAAGTDVTGGEITIFFDRL